MYRNGTNIFGKWKDDLLDGRALIFTPFRGKILANFHDGKLSGWVLAFYGKNILRLTKYYENQIDEDRLTYNDN